MRIATPEAAVPVVLDRAVPSLRANFKWTFAGNVVYAACQWGMVSILAKAGSPAVVGQFALGLAISAPIFMFTNLNLRGVQSTDARSDFGFGDYFTLRMLGSTAGLMLATLISFRLPYDPMTRRVVMLVAISKTVESLSDVVAGLLQKHERLHHVAMSLMIRGVLSLALFGTVFLSLHNLVAAVAAMVATWSTVFLVYDVWRAKAVMGRGESFFGFRKIELRKLLWLSAPLGVVMTLSSLNVNMPRYLLANYLGQAELGIFASMAYLLIAVTLIINALGQSASARLSRMFASGDVTGFLRILKRLLLIGACIPSFGIPVAALFGRRLLVTLYRPEYGGHLGVLVVMVITAGLTAIGSFLGYAVTAARSFRMQIPVIAATCLSTIVFCVVLIPRAGLIGAAFALLISETIFAAGFGIVLRKLLRDRRT
jgi:O-antigen/teichoic acid export membrane protein